ncbi:Trypanosomal VSG domain containing protein, putative [Trypanosoma equiperdum]|uniref:Trypanosomal VSG domain containing protein, putative n=1 Tax=Trypanosoma equiperdum TaxID=5694 RepID=A0A1G4I2K7_TRYEQ|nr:Trypanosomal VSG domain containing protein, putative [Trypanosoma equiperdum]
MSEHIGALNLTAAPDDFTATIDKEKKWETLEENKKPKDQATKELWARYYDFWAAAKQKYESNKAAFDSFGGKNLPLYVKAKLKSLAERAFTIRNNEELAKYAAEALTYDNEVKKALYGGPDKEQQNPDDVPGTRANTCGSASSGQSKAGTSIRRDLTCLCLPATQNQPPNVCCPDCDITTVTTWANAQSAATLFKHLSTNCEHYAPTQELSTGHLNVALAAFYTKIGGVHGSNAKKMFVLGHLDGTGDTDCSGQSAANAGICVIYKEAISSPKKPVIAWIEAAKKAAAAADNIADNAKFLKTLKLELKVLKQTAEDLNITAPQHSETAGQPKPDFNSKTFSTEAKCTPQNKTPEECPSSHCDYNEKATDGNKCKAKSGTGGPENTKGKSISIREMSAILIFFIFLYCLSCLFHKY